MLLDDLIAQHGEGGVVRVAPEGLEPGSTLRWVVEVDGHDVSDLDVRIRPHPAGTQLVVFLVRDDEELEVGRWLTLMHPHGSGLVVTLSELRHRRDAAVDESLIPTA
jgi:hypothetical protein